MRMFLLIATVLVGGLVAGSFAQTSPRAPLASVPNQTNSQEVSEGDVLKINTKLVRVPFAVVNRKSVPVTTLGQEHFKVFEDGKEQSIATFESIEQPLSAVLLIDTSPSARYRLGDIKEAAIAFVNQLRPNDRLMVVAFSNQLDVIMDLSNDREAAQAAIRNVTQGKTTRLYDAIDFLNERLKTVEGRKAVVIFTDGIDNASLTSAQSTLDLADETDLLMYALQYDTFADVSDYKRIDLSVDSGKTTARIYPPGLGPDDYRRATEYLQALAAKSGGSYYHADDLSSIKHAFSRIAAEIRSQYSITYYPRPAVSEKHRHEIDVRVDQPNLIVRARRSYVR